MPKTTRQPKVSIVAVNHNGERFLPKLIDSLKKTKYPNYEIIIVDNGSIDNSLKIIEKYSSKIKVLRCADQGFARGCNAGIKASSPHAEYVVILNEDMYVHPDWLSHLVETMQSDKKIALVGYARLFPESDKIEMLGHKCTNVNLAKSRKIGAGHNLKEYFSKGVIEVDFCLGLMRKSVLEDIGLFDGKNFLMYEEVDICRRMQDAGYKILINPKSKVWHFGSQTIKKASAFRIYYGYRNRLRHVLKHNSGFNKIYYATKLLSVYIYKSLRFSFHGKHDAGWAIVRGIGWNIKNWRDYFD